MVGARRPRRPLPPPPARRGLNMRGGVGALIVGARRNLPPGELYRRGMAGIGDDEGPSLAGSVVDRLVGGKLTEISQQLDDVELLLKVSAGAALFAGIAALVALRRR